jgi:SAM domain (Sterile alpha motif)
MDIVVWLRSLGLGKYEAAFRENEIDETVLHGLTRETLKVEGRPPAPRRNKTLSTTSELARLTRIFVEARSGVV